MQLSRRWEEGCRVAGRLPAPAAAVPNGCRVLPSLPRSVAHDCTMPAALQSTSLRLMYNLIETIFHRRADARTSELYRGLLSSVLECFVRKLGALRMQVGRIVK